MCHYAALEDVLDAFHFIALADASYVLMFVEALGKGSAHHRTTSQLDSLAVQPAEHIIGFLNPSCCYRRSGNRYQMWTGRLKGSAPVVLYIPLAFQHLPHQTLAVLSTFQAGVGLVLNFLLQ